jgi:hypothetical protein
VPVIKRPEYRGGKSQNLGCSAINNNNNNNNNNNKLWLQ